VIIARFALVCVSSSRTTISPRLTGSPSRTRNSPTTPPVGCWTFFTFESTHQKSRRDHRAGELSRRRPAANSQNKEGDCRHTPGEMQAH
jgi:hypothetical protein